GVRHAGRTARRRRDHARRPTCRCCRARAVRVPLAGVTAVQTPLAAPVEPYGRSAADRFMRRVLRLPVDGPKATAADAQRAFQTSVLVAAVRCLLMYIVFPFVLPAIGVARG